MQPLADPELRDHAESMRTLFAEFRKSALERLEDPKRAGIGSPLDKRFNIVFSKLEEKYETLEALTWIKVRSDQAESGRLFLGTIIVWGVIVVASAAGLWNREFRRTMAEEALQRAHGDLELRVKERTIELTGANNRLQQLSLQFHTLLNAIPDRIILVSSDLRILWANRGASSSDGVCDVADPYCYTLLHGASAPCNDCPAIRSFQTGKAENSLISKPDGSIWDLRAFPMVSEEGKVENVIEIATDITEKTTLQAETLRATHLASIGELAAGVAHEINNPINGIINYARILSNKSAKGSSENDVAERIAKEGRRIAGIVKSLLSFARHRTEEKRPVRVESILRESLTLTESQIRKEGIQVRMELRPGLPDIVVNQQQIQQVFMNLINNAHYALSQKYPGEDADKVLDIICEEIPTEKNSLVRVTFHDHGIGIAPEVMDKIMNPFFTTKPMGIGTGLGLSISHGIIADHGGRITVKSVQGEYTKVLVDLPAGGKHG